MKTNKKKALIICLSVIFALCVVGSIAVIIIINHKPSSKSEIDCKIAYEQYNNVKGTLQSIESDCANDDGYIESSNVDSTINTMISKLNGLKDDGVIINYEKEDTGIFIELASGVGYLHTLNIKDMMPGDQLGKIVTIEPYAANKELVVHYLLGGRSPDKSAEKIAASFSDEYKFDNQLSILGKYAL